jgi:hypothetical protein
LYFTGDTNTGLYSPGADQVAISTNGTNRLHIDSDGKVGLGSSSPDALLTVNGVGAFGAGAVTTPSIAATGDLNTGFWFPAADTIAASTGGSERARIDSSGRVLIGTSTAASSSDAQYAFFQIEGSSAASSNAGAWLALRRSQSASSIAAASLISNIASTDNTGNVFAQISCFADATAGTNDYPGRLVFSTTADGASSPTERLRIAQNGAWGLAGANYGSSAQVLTSNGSGSAPTWQAAPAPAALSTASGSAPSYSARAWVNFNGTGTVAILASGNVSSITDNGTGDYTVNFTTAMVDANYSAVMGNISFGVGSSSDSATLQQHPTVAPTTSAFRLVFWRASTGNFIDMTYGNASFFR